MAFLPIPFPEDWPDFVVTSHKRKDGTHASGLAFDITPVWEGEKTYDSKFWFYYFHTFFVLWSAQSRGRTRAAVPPTCPHYHIFYDPNINEIGLEWLERLTNKTTGKKYCHTYYHRDVSKYDINDIVKFRNFAENYVATGNKKNKYYGTWGNVWEQVKHKFDFTTKKVKVTSNFESLPDEKLQQILDAMYGESSGARFLDELTHVVTGNTWEGFKDKAGANLIMWGALAGLGYLIYKEISAPGSPRSRTFPNRE